MSPAIERGFATSWRWKKKFGLPSRCAMLARAPVERLSTHTTSCGPLASRSHKWDPMRPAPPVTRMRAMGTCADRKARLMSLADGAASREEDLVDHRERARKHVRVDAPPHRRGRFSRVAVHAALPPLLRPPDD